MKRYGWILILIVWLAGTATAFGQEETIVCDSDVLGTHQRPLVVFPHGRHMAEIDCSRCHHDFDAYGVNFGGDGQPCASCHTPSAADNPVPLVRAFHLQCKGCHRRVAQPDTPLPVMCGQCHRR